MWSNVGVLHHLVFEWSVLHRRSLLGMLVPLPEHNHPSLSPISLLAARWLGHQPSCKWVSGWWEGVTPYAATPLEGATWAFGVLTCFMAGAGVTERERCLLFQIQNQGIVRDDLWCTAKARRMFPSTSWLQGTGYCCDESDSWLHPLRYSVTLPPHTTWDSCPQTCHYSRA